MEVVQPFPSHAALAHLTDPADILTAINDISVDSVQHENIAKLLMGPLESVVELRFMRPVDR